MYKNNICTLQIGKVQLGVKTHGPENNIHRRNIISPFIRGTGVEKNNRQIQLQIKARKGKMTNKYEGRTESHEQHFFCKVTFFIIDKPKTPPKST